VLTEIFYHVDNFCKDYEEYLQTIQIIDKEKSKRGPKPKLHLSEVITIIVYFHHSKFRTFKDYYLFLKRNNSSAFTCLVSYNRFLELQKQTLIPMMIFLSITSPKHATNTSFIDSTSIKVCHNKRIYSHKTFKGLAARGKTSVGWFYGFKLHLVINEYGEIIAFNITAGNIADNNTKVLNHLTKNISGKLFGDKGYISDKNFKTLWNKGIHLITGIRRNMKNKLMDYYDKILLKKRGIIESVNNLLKNSCMLEHSRHRSICNFFVNILASLGAYTFLKRKPAIRCFNKALIDLN